MLAAVAAIAKAKLFVCVAKQNAKDALDASQPARDLKRQSSKPATARSRLTFRFVFLELNDREIIHASHLIPGNQNGIQSGFSIRGDSDHVQSNEL